MARIKIIISLLLLFMAFSSSNGYRVPNWPSWANGPKQPKAPKGPKAPKVKSVGSSSSSSSEDSNPPCFASTVLPRHCKDLLDNGCTVSGLYTIYPTQSLTPSCDVWCDQETDGGGWTVIQRRVSGAVDFERDMAAYAAGFGDLATNFWLGLDKIHLLTSTVPQELRFDMEATDLGNSAWAHYNSFLVGDAASLYLLTVGGYVPNPSGAGDSFTYHSGMVFTTYTDDNDPWGGNCAVAYTGAWWYKSCHYSNPNGQYLDGVTTIYGKGVVWYYNYGYYYSLEYIDMKIRPQ